MDIERSFCATLLFASVMQSGSSFSIWHITSIERKFTVSVASVVSVDKLFCSLVRLLWRTSSNSRDL
uniref:Putative secreted peptide n=1 Tax=Anopheles braziliensis TaxID=58242 RepID=A0A2M3ZVG0_9DIPT